MRRRGLNPQYAFIPVHHQQIPVTGQMNELYIRRKGTELSCHGFHLTERKPHTVKGNQAAAAVLGNHIAAQHHLILGNIPVLGQQFQIRPVGGKGFFRNTQKPQDTGQTFRYYIIFTDTDLRQFSFPDQSVYVRVKCTGKRSLSIPGRNRIVSQSVN